MKTILISMLLCLCLPAMAQEKDAPPKPKEHPAAKVASGYLMASAFQIWSEMVELVDSASLDDVKRDQVQHIKNSPTMEVERSMLKKYGYKDVGEMEMADSKKFFVVFNKAQHADIADRENRLDQMQKTLKIRAIGQVEETPNLVHVLLRSSHHRGDVIASAFDIISLVKTRGGSWKVSLNAQLPKFSPIEKPIVPIDVLEAENLEKKKPDTKQKIPEEKKK